MMTDVPTQRGASAPGGSIGELGLWPVVLGAAIALLAPLGGFLGGTVVGSTGGGENLNAMALWLMAGLAVGTVGAFIVCVGALRWFTVHRGRSTAEPAGHGPTAG